MPPGIFASLFVRLKNAENGLTLLKFFKRFLTYIAGNFEYFFLMAKTKKMFRKIIHFSKLYILRKILLGNIDEMRTDSFL